MHPGHLVLTQPRRSSIRISNFIFFCAKFLRNCMFTFCIAITLKCSSAQRNGASLIVNLSLWWRLNPELHTAEHHAPLSYDHPWISLSGLLLAAAFVRKKHTLIDLCPLVCWNLHPMALHSPSLSKFTLSLCRTLLPPLSNSISHGAVSELTFESSMSTHQGLKFSIGSSSCQRYDGAITDSSPRMRRRSVMAMATSPQR